MLDFELIEIYGSKKMKQDLQMLRRLYLYSYFLIVFLCIFMIIYNIKLYKDK